MYLLPLLFAILFESRNSRKLGPCENMVVYSIRCFSCGTVSYLTRLMLAGCLGMGSIRSINTMYRKETFFFYFITYSTCSVGPCLSVSEMFKLTTVSKLCNAHTVIGNTPRPPQPHWAAALLESFASLEIAFVNDLSH